MPNCPTRAYLHVHFVQISAEHAASIVDGAIITTGGGFSAHVPRPSWQEGAVSKWVSGQNPAPLNPSTLDPLSPNPLEPKR